MTEYRAIHDIHGHYIRTDAKRRCLVVMFRDGKYGWICGSFGNMKAAEKRAAELNKTEA